MRSHIITEFLDRQAQELAREEEALVRIVGERLQRIGRIYARGRLAEMLLAPSEGRIPEGTADGDDDPPAPPADVSPPSAPRVLFGVAVPEGRDPEAREIVAEARERAASRTAGGGPYAARDGVEAWMSALSRAAHDEACHSETFIADFLRGLVEEEGESAAGEGHGDRVLALLADRGSPMLPREIVQALGMNPKAVGPVMGKLCRSGRATRMEDGRYAIG